MTLQVTATQRAAGVIRKKAQVNFYGLLPGQRVYLAEVQLGNLVVDDSYQRELDENHPVMGSEFVGIAQGLADVVFTGRELHTADGQHRVRTLVGLGQNRADVLLFEGVSHQQEADLYYIKNKHKKRTDGWNAFNAGIEGNRIKETAIYAAIKAEGLTTPLQQPDNPELTGVAVLEEAYRTKRNATVGGIPLLKRFLSVLRKGWSINRRQGLQQAARNIQTQRGLLRFIKANWHLTEAQLIAVLRQNDATYVNSQAALRASHRKVSRAEANYVKAILEGLFSNQGHQVRKAA